ncbi:MAG TPA: ATP-binding protein [Pyrinomonadaceae bacterium]|nr:ATP-binding protein [Pyrinomonadaceae bacterium]
MFLKEIELTNFKCHESLYLNFDTVESGGKFRKTTFLLGENGTGKSALLKAIALITAGSTALGDLLGVSDDWIKNGHDFCEIKAVIKPLRGEEHELKLRIERNASLSAIISKNLESLEWIDRAIAHTDRNYFVAGYGASRRLNKDSQFFSNDKRSSSARSQNIQSLFNTDSSLISLSSWAIELDYTNSNEGLATVKKALDAFLVDNVKFKTIDKQRKQLIFSTPDGEIPLEQLSDGYQNVAAWVGDLMYRINDNFHNFNEPLKARGLLLIDEIDLHLHPKWQRQLYNFLKNKLPNFQVIATTHSPLTVQQADENELYALRRSGKKVELIPFRGAPNKMLLHQILMSPVFGLETDESLEVERAKTKIRSISLKPEHSDADKTALRSLTGFIEETPMNLRSNGLLTGEDVELLNTINRELKAKK